MKLKTLSEVIYKFYEHGRPKATARTFSQGTIMQRLRMAVAAVVRTMYRDAKDKTGEEDYSFSSPFLSSQKFELDKPLPSGARRADMSQFDLYRLPKNAHIVTVLLVGDCGGEEKYVTMVKPGEERFYQSAEFKKFKFGVLKGRGINVYNVPSSIKEIEVESTFDSDDIDVSMDVAYEAGRIVLEELMKIKMVPLKTVDNSFDPNTIEYRRRLEEQEGQKL